MLRESAAHFWGSVPITHGSDHPPFSGGSCSGVAQRSQEEEALGHREGSGKQPGLPSWTRVPRPFPEAEPVRHTASVRLAEAEEPLCSCEFLVGEFQAVTSSLAVLSGEQDLLGLGCHFWRTALQRVWRKREGQRPSSVDVLSF